MGGPASKRRKLEHTSSQEEDDAASFASFGASEEEDSGNEQEGHDGVADGIDGAEAYEEEGDGEEEHDDEESDQDVAQVAGAEQQASAPAIPKPPSQKTSSSSSAPRRRPGDEVAFTSGSSKSNVFKLQVDELLEQIRPRHGKRETAAEGALHAIKKSIDQISTRPALPIEDAERKLMKGDKVAVPFPHPRPPKDAKYKLEYQKPANVNVVGSHALKTVSRARDVCEVDMVLFMPSAMFQEKDYMNYRYFYKRAYYLACVAAAVKSAHGAEYEVRFANSRDNALHPAVIVEPPAQEAKAKWRINILACVSENTFPPEKLRLEKNCVRSSSEQDSAQSPTPFYNSSLRAEMLVAPYLKLLHLASKNCEAFRDACLLGSTWLRRRGLGSNMHAGGFGNFEWSAVIALLLSGGGRKGTSILSNGYSSYQLFKATLQVFAMKDLSKQPLIVGDSAYAPKPQSSGAPVVWDAERSHNLLFKMAPWAYKRLKQEARLTLQVLGDQQYDGFDATFILRSDGLQYRYDAVLEVPIPVNKEVLRNHLPNDSQYKLFKTLQRGLGDRVSQINIMAPATSSRSTDAASDEQQSTQTLRVGLVVNSETVGGTVDHGPSAEQKSEAASFRKFWGEKAELRRFKDGSIMESLVWSANEGGRSVLEQVVRYLVKMHVGEDAEAGMTFTGDSIKQMLPQGLAAAPFLAFSEAYKLMESDIRGLQGLPLSIRQITPADTQLRSASVQAPTTGSRPVPADVIIQFEGSGRWPDNLVAIQRTKIAFLLKLSELLQPTVSAVTPRIGLESQHQPALNQAHLDLIYPSTNAAFRLRIYHDREQTLFQRQLKDKALDPRSKELAALGLAKHRRDYIRAPAHTQALARLCSRYPALSGTIRAVKKWFASHLLANHIPPEVIELLCAKTFIQPYPWQTPSSVQTAFLRTLFFLSRWDWRAEPLVVDLSGSGDLSSDERQAIHSKFEAWRKIGPVLNRVVLFAASNVDFEGTTWTDGVPAKVVAGRMTALAKAACAEISGKGVQLEVEALFASDLKDFDFVVHLDPSLCGKAKKKTRKNQAGFKNLELQPQDDTSSAGYDPVQDFLSELETLFGAAALFFSGAPERPVIAGLWNPQTKERAWKLNLAYSTVPKAGAGEEDVKAEVNKEGILAEIARVGGGMVERVEVGGR